MFENIGTFFKRIIKTEPKQLTSKDAAKERLHLVLMQDRANVSADFLELMKQEIIDVIKKYIEIDEKAIDVRLTNQENSDGTNGAPALYANIPIINIKNELKAEKMKEGKSADNENKSEDSSSEKDSEEKQITIQEAVKEVEKEANEKKEEKPSSKKKKEIEEESKPELDSDIKPEEVETEDIKNNEENLKEENDETDSEKEIAETITLDEPLKQSGDEKKSNSKTSKK